MALAHITNLHQIFTRHFRGFWLKLHWVHTNQVIFYALGTFESNKLIACEVQARFDHKKQPVSFEIKIIDVLHLKIGANLP
jgi:hypothetical protein